MTMKINQLLHLRMVGNPKDCLSLQFKVSNLQKLSLYAPIPRFSVLSVPSKLFVTILLLIIRPK